MSCTCWTTSAIVTWVRRAAAPAHRRARCECRPVTSPAPPLWSPPVNRWTIRRAGGCSPRASCCTSVRISASAPRSWSPGRRRDSCRSPTWGARPSPSTECGHSDSPVAVGEEVARMDGVVADWRSARRDGTRLRTVDKYPRNSTQLWFNIRREATPRHCGSSVSRLLRAQRRRWPQRRRLWPERRRLWPDSRPSARWAVAAAPLVVGLPLLVGPAPAGAMASMALRQTALGWGAGLAGLRSTGPALAHTVLSRGPGDLDLPLPPATSAARSGVGADGAGPALLDPTRLAGLAGAGIPPVVLGAYQGAVAQLAVTNPGCLLRWTVLAGIGKVESNHGRDGAGITAAGTILPAILGPVFDGTGGNAAIPDTDRGRLDGDPVWDRAVGPMQFIPGTWMGVAPKGDPNSIVDATVAAGRYLCSGGRDLADPRQLAAAIHAYNPSDAYVAVVLAWISAYDAAGPAAVPTAPLLVLPTVAPPAAGWLLAFPRAPVPAAAAVAAPAPTWRPEVTNPLPTTPVGTEPPPTTASPTSTASPTPSPVSYTHLTLPTNRKV